MSVSERTEAFYLALGVFFLGMAVFGGHFYSGDGMAYFTVSLKLTLFEAPTIAEFLEGYGVRGAEGGYYSKFGLGYSLGLIPFVVLTLLVAYLMGYLIHGPVLYAGVMLSGPVLGGIGVYLFHRLQCLLDFGKASRLFGSICFGVGGLWLVYTRFLFSELFVAVLLLVGANTMDLEISGDDLLMGAASGLAVLSRIEVIVLVLPLLYLKWSDNGSLIRLFLPLLTGVVTIGFYNWARFGNPLFSGMGHSKVETFSTPILKGFYGQFFAPGNGLFLYGPYLGVTLVIALLLTFRMEVPSFELTMVGLGSLLYVLIHSAWHSWMGGWSWGPRRMIPLLPFLHLSVPWAWSHAKKGLKGLLILLLIVGIFVNFGGLFGDFNDYYRGTFYQKDVLFTMKNAQVIQQPLGIVQGRFPLDNFWIRGLGLPLGGFVFGVWLLLGVVCLFNLRSHDFFFLSGNVDLGKE